MDKERFGDGGKKLGIKHFEHVKSYMLVRHPNAQNEYQGKTVRKVGLEI